MLQSVFRRTIFEAVVFRLKRDLMAAEAETALMRMSSDVRLKTLRVGECDVNIISPCAQVPHLDLFLQANPKGGVHHIAVQVKNISEVLSVASSCDIPNIGDLVGVLSAVSDPDYSTIETLGYFEEKVGGLPPAEFCFSRCESRILLC